MASLVGSRVERKEDKRFLTGKGRYTADINLANQTYAIFVRSPHARASIKKLNIDINQITLFFSNYAFKMQQFPSFSFIFSCTFKRCWPLVTIETKAIENKKS